MPSSRKQVGTSAAEIEAAFYDAIGRADIKALMALWADDEEIVCIHPGAPRLIGHHAIRASWEALFERSGIQIRPVQLHVIHNLMTVIHHVIEEIPETDNAPDVHDVHILATNVYLKTPRGWRIVLHH